MPPAHYAAAKSAFVALRDKVGPISLLDTPSIRTANRKADAAPADSLAAQVRSENPLAAQYADTILRRIVCCDTPDTLENYPDSATRDLLRHHPFRLERLRTPQRYIGLDARRARAEALTKALDELTARRKEAAQSAAALKAARDSYQDVLHSSVMDELAALWDARAVLEAARILDIQFGSFDVIEAAEGNFIIDANSVSNVSEDCTELFGFDLMAAYARALAARYHTLRNATN